MKRLFFRRTSASGAALLLMTLTGCKDEPVTPEPPTPTEDWPAIQSAIPKDPAIEAKVDALVAGMSLEEKVGQILQVEIPNVTAEEVKKYHIGSVLNGGGSWPNGKASSVADWTARADELWAASMDPANPHQIPIIWGTDAVHGHNNVKGATFFPHNIGLGAANDPELMRRIGEVTAREVARTGIDWAFGPTIAVVRDDRWGRTYEGYSEDPAIVESYAGKVVEGLQGQLAKDANSGEKVLASAKHFLADGATTDGKDQGISVLTEKELRELHGRGYYTALQAGSQTVMASFNSWQDKAQGNNAKAYKMHGNKYLLTDVLKTKMGFDGFVISDWNGLAQVKRENSDAARDCTEGDCPQAINAGVDMAMIPARKDWMAFITNTIASVKSGEIPQARLDDAVRRILRVKFRAGLFDKPKPSERVKSHELGTEADRAVAREAVRKSLVLLKNNGGVLPVARNAKVLVVGKSADSLSNQSGGWSLTWQGTNNVNADFGGGTTFWGAVQKVAPQATLDTSRDGKLADSSYDVVFVVIGETPYAEGNGDLGKSNTLEFGTLFPEDSALIASLRAKQVKKIVTVLYAGRPLYMNKEINQSDAFVAAWLPGTEGDGVTDVLFRKADGAINHDFQGRLSYSWPKQPCQTSLNKGDATYDPQFAYGHGLTYTNSPELGTLDAPTRDYGCGVVPGEGGTASVPLELFDSGNRANWVMRLGAPSNWGGTEVVLGTSDTTSMAPNEISATPVDYQGKQWAAVRAVWNGTGQIYMQNRQGNETLDLRSYLNSKGALVFETRVDKAPVSGVNLSMHCKHPCLGEIQITDTLRGISGQGWKQLAVPLSCFTKLDFAIVNTPFLIYTDGEMDLTVANIRWEPNRQGNVACTSTSTPDTVIPVDADRDIYVNGVYDASLLARPSSWTDGPAGHPGAVALDPEFSTDGEKVIDVKMTGFQKGVSNGGIALGLKSPNLLDATPVRSTGGVEFELRMLDYGETTMPFWVKIVCNRSPGDCTTGDLDKRVGRPALNTWKTVRIPFSDAAYTKFDATKMSSVFEMLPAWGDQGGNVHFQLRNVRLKKQLPSDL